MDQFYTNSADRQTRIGILYGAGKRLLLPYQALEEVRSKPASRAAGFVPVAGWEVPPRPAVTAAAGVRMIVASLSRPLASVRCPSRLVEAS